MTCSTWAAMGMQAFGLGVRLGAVLVSQPCMCDAWTPHMSLHKVLVCTLVYTVVCTLASSSACLVVLDVTRVAHAYHAQNTTRDTPLATHTARDTPLLTGHQPASAPHKLWAVALGEVGSDTKVGLEVLGTVTLSSVAAFYLYGLCSTSFFFHPPLPAAHLMPLVSSRHINRQKMQVYTRR